MKARVQAKPILHYETAQRAKYLINYTERVNDEASALCKYGSIHKLPIEWAMNKLNPMGDVPKDKILDELAKRIRASSREEKRSFKSGLPHRYQIEYHLHNSQDTGGPNDQSPGRLRRRAVLHVGRSQPVCTGCRAGMDGGQVRPGLLGSHRWMFDDEGLCAFCQQHVALGPNPSSGM